MLRHEPMQAKRDSLTAPPLAGRDYRQVYFVKSHHASAKILGTRRGSRSAACVCWAASILILLYGAMSPRFRGAFRHTRESEFK